MKKVEKISLNGIWRLINEKFHIDIRAEVPGSVFETLLLNELIEDPFYGLNEHKVSWVYDTDWIYETQFNVKPEFINHSNIKIRVLGIDTISDIYLNGMHLGSTENMFLTYDFEVKDKLKTESNILKIIIKSPTIKAFEEIKKHGITLITNMEALPGIPYLRKAQYSGGWDWGPKLADIAIYPIELIGYDEVKINSLYPIQRFTYNKNPFDVKNPEEISTIHIDSVNLQIKIELDSDMEDLDALGYIIKVILIGPDGITFTESMALKSKNHQFDFNINNPQLWWTHDLGAANLYEISVMLEGENIIDKLTQKIGIRDIRLIRNPDIWGETFYFQLNGIPLFAKGANWIPIDSFIPRGKK